jgi:sulfite reductase (ferredoxin)
MKYLIHDRGIAWFAHELKRYFKHPIKSLRNEPKAQLVDYLGWHRQAPGKWFVGLPLLCGRLAGPTKAGLRQLVDTYKLEVRITPNQDLLLCNIGTGQRTTLVNALAAIGLRPRRPRHCWPAMQSPAPPCPSVAWRLQKPSAFCRRCSIGSMVCCGASALRNLSWCA